MAKKKKTMMEKRDELSKALQEAKKGGDKATTQKAFVNLRRHENKMEEEKISFTRFTDKGRLRNNEAIRLSDYGMDQLGFKAEPKQAAPKKAEAKAEPPNVITPQEPPNVMTPPDASSNAFGRQGGKKEMLQDVAEIEAEKIDYLDDTIVDSAEVETQEDILTREEAGFQQELERVEKFYDDREKTLLSAAEKDANENLREEAVKRAYIDAGRTFDQSAYNIARARIRAREAFNNAAEDPNVPHNNLRGDDKVNTGTGVSDGLQHSSTAVEVATDPLGEQTEVVAEAQAKAEDVVVTTQPQGALRGNAQASSSREEPTPAPTQPEQPFQPTTGPTEPMVVNRPGEKITSSSVPTIDIETPVEGQAQAGGVGVGQAFSGGIPASVFNRNEAQAINDEDKKRSKKTIDVLKEEIRAYHIVYDDNIPVFKTLAHQGGKRDALKSNDIKVVRRHHKSMEETIRNYFKTTSLKIGVIYDINSIKQQPIGLPQPGAIPGMTRQEIISRAATGETNKQSLNRTMRFTDPYGRAIAGDVNPPRGGLHSHQQAPIKRLIPKSGKITTKPGKIYNPVRGVDAPYQYVLKRPSREMAISVKIKGLNSGSLI